MTRQTLGIHILGWIARQDNPNASLDARTLLAASGSGSEPITSHGLADLLDVPRKEAAESIRRLRSAQYLYPNNVIAPRGETQVRRIIQPK